MSDSAREECIRMDHVPTTGRWLVDRGTLLGFASNIPAIAWPAERATCTADVKRHLDDHTVVVMADAVPGIRGTLEGYALDGPISDLVKDVMHGIDGPGLVSSWVIQDESGDLVDSLVGVSSEVIEDLSGEGTAFWDLGKTDNPHRALSAHWNDSNREDSAITDVSFGLSGDSRIVLVEHIKHPRNEYRLIIRGGSVIANTYLANAGALTSNTMTVKDAAPYLEQALNIVRRHHATLAHAIIEDMIERIPNAKHRESLADNIYEVLRSPQFNADFGRNGTKYAVSDTEQVFNHIVMTEDDRFVFYNKCTSLQTARGAVFLDSGEYYVAIMEAGRACIATTTTTFESEAPHGSAYGLWAFPMSSPLMLLPTADMYEDGPLGYDSPREDYSMNKNISGVVQSLLGDRMYDTVRFIRKSVAFESSTAGYRPTMNRILYSYQRPGVEVDQATGYPHPLPPITKGMLLNTRVVFAIYNKAILKYVRVSGTPGINNIPHGGGAQSSDIAVLLPDGRAFIPYLTILWMYYNGEFAEEIDNYYNGRGTLPKEFRNDIIALRTKHAFLFPHAYLR